MRPNPIPLITAFFLSCFSVFGQDARYDILLKNGKVSPVADISSKTLEEFNKALPRFRGKAFVIIQFDQLPTANERIQIKNAGIELLDYVPHNAFTATVSGNIIPSTASQLRIRSVISLGPEQKILPQLLTGNFPPWATRQTGTIDLWITYPKSFSLDEVRTALQLLNVDVTSTSFSEYFIIGIRIAQSRLFELATQPVIEYIEPAPHEDQPLINRSRANSRATILQAPVSSGGRNLNGENMVIGIGDNALPFHIDFNGRIIDRAGASNNYHGTHVHGIAGGGGILKELYQGYLPKANLLSQAFSGVWQNAPVYFNDHRMIVTNNSYGAIVNECSYNGLYDNYSRILDQLSISLPKVQHVFAAGNSATGSGYAPCPPYPTDFKTVLGSYQSAKNVLTVGNTYPYGDIFPQSSRGPVRDGRIKPEITAQGSFVMSTATFAPYFQNTGTSMAAPAVSGGLGLLYQRYRQLHADADPENGLMKAILCNTAADRGNAGPDYTYGFGWMNLVRAVEVLEKNQYVTNSISTGGNNSFNISVPSNTAQLKVMLYWNDPAAAAVSYQTLVNDLDLSVVEGSTTYLPWTLDTVPANVNNPATRAVDHINNIEQVTIDNPVAGTYSINVSGFAVPQNSPQQYFVVYDTVMISTRLTFPAGGDKLLPGESIVVNWDSYGSPANNFTLEFFNGTSWSVVDAAIPAASRQYTTTVPSIATDQARYRISRNGTSMISTGEPVIILGAPRIVKADSTCEGYLHLKWRTVTGATDYEVMRLQSGAMVNVGTTADTVFLFTGLPVNTDSWISVRARYNGSAGRRDTAFVVRPVGGACDSSIHNNDLKLDAIINPATSGRILTSTALSASVPLTIRIKNLDNAAAPPGNITVSYSVNGGTPINEIISNPVIPALGTLEYSFAATVDMSATGSYTIQATVVQPGDPFAGNNSFSKTFKQLDNQPVSLATTWLDNLESAASQTVQENQMGLTGLDRYDFSGSTIYRRLRSFVNTGIAYSGNRAITLDVYGFIGALVNIDSLTGTFNLAAYDVNNDDVRLDFRFKNHGQGNHAANKVWIRGADNQNWIEVYNLYVNQLPVDEGYKLSPAISVSDSLKAHGQVLTSSFQVRWGQAGSWNMADAQSAGGYSFDDIRLFKVTDDLQLIAIDTPTAVSCNLNASTPVRIVVRNNSENATVNPVPVRYRIDGGSWVTENISPIAANTTVTYTFTTPIGVIGSGSHLLETEVVYPTDDFQDNDTLSRTFFNSGMISSFPYLEDFETGNGGWHSEGKMDSWQYGTPSSYKINKAASGSKAWKTRSTGNYNDGEKSYLYSPCFNLAGMTVPTLSFSVALDLEDCGGSFMCDGAYMEYSTDGITWLRLGAAGQGTNWYNRNYSGGTNPVWSIQNYTRWHVATIPLPLNASSLRLRFVVSSDASVNREGIAVDDVHIYDNIYGIYPGPTMTTAITQNITGGTSWINFIEPVTQKLVASVQPNNQNMGNTSVQCYINTGPVRVSNTQYYHDRNITIIPPQGMENLADSATVRFYFLDSETENLLNANSCGYCSRPASAYELGVSKYSHPSDNSIENGTIDDNLVNYWSFINSPKVRKVPFDRGYYAEFKVKNFSEFWLNNGSFDNNTPLPVQLLSFTAKKKNQKDVLAEWKTTEEINVNRFEIEMARGNTGYQLNDFSKLGEVTAAGNSSVEKSYQFTDQELNKTGVRYYRLKIIDNDGGFSYSAIRPVVFTSEFKWQVYPNPSSGSFHFIFQLDEGEILQARVLDISGRIVKQIDIPATGFRQKLTIDLESASFPPGIYMLQVNNSTENQGFKLLKQ